MNNHQTIIICAAVALPVAAMFSKSVTGCGLWLAYMAALALVLFAILHP